MRLVVAEADLVEVVGASEVGAGFVVVLAGVAPGVVDRFDGDGLFAVGAIALAVLLVPLALDTEPQ